MTRTTSIRTLDFEKLGYDTMLATHDDRAAREICAHKLMELNANVTPEISDTECKLQTKSGQAAALHAQLYDRTVPVSDTAMVSRNHRLMVYASLCLFTCAASVVSHGLTFYFFGFNAVLSMLIAVALTGIVLAVGHATFEEYVARYKSVQAALVLGAFVCCFWGLVQMALARGTLAAKAVATSTTASESQSYVDDPAADMPPTGSNDGESEAKLRQLLNSALLKIMLAADLMLGLLFGAIMSMVKDDDFESWRHLKKVGKEITALKKHEDVLRSIVEIAKRQCAAGILRAKSIPAKKHVPFHQLPVAVLAVVLVTFASQAAHAQHVCRMEGILLDTSGSIGQGVHQELLQEYMAETKRLLATEPPCSRVYVSVISTDSFGSVRELVKGWTPEQKGVFTDDLNRARRQLVSSFETKAAGLAAVSAGTDIFGGLWHMKSLIESASNGQAVEKEIWIDSDMVNETPAFNMPALLSLGRAQMVEKAKSNGLVVPLQGYKIHVQGASIAGMTPQLWNRVKAFWTAYFRESGADLVSYSVESAGSRQ